MESNLPASTNLTELQKAMVDILPDCRSLKEAALKAGFAESTAANIKSKIRNSPNWAVAVKQAYLNNNIVQLPQINNIEQDLIDIIAQNPEEYPKYKDVIKQIKQQAGVLQTDQDYNKPSQTLTLNVRDILVQINEAQPQENKGLRASGADIVDVKAQDVGNRHEWYVSNGVNLYQW